MKKRNRGAPTPAPFALPGDQVTVMLAAYYRQLNSHPPIRSDIAALRERLDLQFPADGAPSARARRGAEAKPEYPWTAADAWVPVRARTELRAFANRWNLPPASARDALYAICLAPAHSDPELLCAGRTHVGAAPHAVIRGDQPSGFVYDPVSVTPAEARRRARQAGAAVQQQMLGHIEQAEQEWLTAGWRPLPPRSSSRADLEEGARRLFQRAVLRWSWRSITDDAAGRERAYNEATVVDGVTRWAQQLGVPLLPDGASARPKQGQRLSVTLRKSAC